jgi:hypothetical protein
MIHIKPKNVAAGYARRNIFGFFYFLQAWLHALTYRSFLPQYFWVFLFLASLVTRTNLSLLLAAIFLGFFISCKSLDEPQ